ncbi:MAG: hypothetical protein BWY58_00140 [Chloroflexi bacterium ADurb.Bin344]|nr:MAG: hypothetical protein BWY58_00140 [Chloroflexi bacterium ADurb.Bin344]
MSIEHCFNIVCRQLSVVSVAGKQGFPETGQRRPIKIQFVDFTFWNAAEHKCMNIPMFRTGAVVDVAGNIQIVIVLPDFIQTHRAGISGRGNTPDHGVGNPPDVRGAKLVAFPHLGIAVGGIDNHHIGIRTILFQYHNNGRDARPEENVRGQTDNRVNVIEFQKLFANLPLRITSKKNAVRQNNRHNAIRLEVIEIMEQKGIIRLGFRRDSKVGKTRVVFFVVRFPMLGIRRIGDHRIDIQRIIGSCGIALIKKRPVVFQRVAVSGYNVIRQDASHDQIHSSEVVRILFQLLCIVFDSVRLMHIPGNGTTDIDKQRTGTAGRVVNFNLIAVSQMIGDNFRHQQRYFVRRIKFTGLFPSVGGEHANQVFINESKYIIILPPVHRNIFYQLK